MAQVSTAQFSLQSCRSVFFFCGRLLQLKLKEAEAKNACLACEETVLHGYLEGHHRTCR